MIIDQTVAAAVAAVLAAAMACDGSSGGSQIYSYMAVLFIFSLRLSLSENIKYKTLRHGRREEIFHNFKQNFHIQLDISC